jgi:hypothetical protein
LEPLGALTGRVLAADGRPGAGLRVTAEPVFGKAAYEKLFGPDFRGLPRSWHKETLRRATAGADGRFRVEGLIPGLSYRLRASDGEVQPWEPAGLQRDGLTVEPGKDKDLGDLKADPIPKKP